MVSSVASKWCITCRTHDSSCVRKAVREFEKFEALKMAPVTKANYHVYVMRRYIAAANITLIIIFSEIGTNRF
jgi:hypothetical protein